MSATDPCSENTGLLLRVPCDFRGIDEALHEEADRGQRTLLPECLGDLIDESNPFRVIDVFVDALGLAEMGLEVAEPAATGRRSYHPSVLLKLYIYGYLNRGSRAGGWNERPGAMSR